MPIASALDARGVEVIEFATVGPLIAAMAELPFAAVIVSDDTDGASAWLTALQVNLAPQTAVVVVGPGGTARMAHALQLGADDYMVAGTDPEPMVERALARISAKLRTPRQRPLQAAGFTLDVSQGTLRGRAHHVRLTARELTAAHLLFEQRDQLVSTQQLCRALCGRVDPQAERAVQQHVYGLRKKILLAAAAGENAPRIETVYGQGYRLHS